MRLMGKNKSSSTSTSSSSTPATSANNSSSHDPLGDNDGGDGGGAAAPSTGNGNNNGNGSSKNDAADFYRTWNDPDVVERVRVKIANAHVFKLPPRQSAGGWRGADWREKVWQGNVKVVERGDKCAVVLADRSTDTVFAVCPVYGEGAVDRCVDSSRYFVLRIENDRGRHMFIGMAFNERNDAFDFNTSLEDARREREAELRPVRPYTGPTKDYSIKEGEKIHVNIKKISGNDVKSSSSSSSSSAVSLPAGKSKSGGGVRSFFGGGGDKSKSAAKKKVNPSSPGGGRGFLAPPSNDTPARAATDLPQAGGNSSGNDNNRLDDPFASSFSNGNDVSFASAFGDDPFADSSAATNAFLPG